MKNNFAEEYKREQEIKARFDAAEKENDEEGKKAAGNHRRRAG